MRKYILIDVNRFENMRSFHEYMARELEFPDYYGHNLDALYDCLTDVEEPVCLIVMNSKVYPDALEGRLAAVLSVLESAAGENSNITVRTL